MFGRSYAELFEADALSFTLSLSPSLCSFFLMGPLINVLNTRLYCYAARGREPLEARSYEQEGTCLSGAAVLAVELPISKEDLTVEAQTFVAKETGKWSVVVREEVGGGELYYSPL